MVEIHIRHGEASAQVGWGLTDEGKRQARLAAEYLRDTFPQSFQTVFHSGSRRAMETADLLLLSGPAWKVDARLREPNWEGRPESRTFEPWKSTFEQVSEFCRELDETHSGQDRVIVSHGGVMRMVRAYREGLAGDRFPVLFDIPYKYFTNCQILIYADRNPEGADQEGGLWVRSVCPWNVGAFGHDWMPVRN